MNYIILAGGCFWGAEDLFSKLPGVTDTLAGYTGGTVLNPKYEDLKGGMSGHAEAVKITYDENTISLTELLHFFFKMHDPTTLNRQGGDVGTQYRSAIFIKTDDQKEVAVQVIKQVNEMKRFPNPITTSLEDEAVFYPAEEHHQDYLKKNPGGYSCHFIRD